jgi:hypothetical protein
MSSSDQPRILNNRVLVKNATSATPPRVAELPGQGQDIGICRDGPAAAFPPRDHYGRLRQEQAIKKAIESSGPNPHQVGAGMRVSCRREHWLADEAVCREPVS